MRTCKNVYDCNGEAVGLLVPERDICGFHPIEICEEHYVDFLGTSGLDEWSFISFEDLSALVAGPQIPLNERLDDLQRTIHGLEVTLVDHGGELEHISAHLMGHGRMGHRPYPDHYHGSGASIS